MKILVTGASGFLGTVLCRRLEAQGHVLVRISTASADLTNPHSLSEYQSEKYDRIYHLAAWTRAGDFCLSHQAEQWLINQQLNTNVLAWWSKYQPTAKLVAIGTSCAYAPDRPLTESEYLQGRPSDDLFSYAMTKRMLYAGLISFKRQYGLDYLYLTPATLYGPGYHTDGRQMHFIFDLILKILKGRILNEPVILWGDGNQKREILYIEDFVDALVALPEICSNEILNIGPGVEYSIRQYAEWICAEVGFDSSRIKFDENRYVGVRSKCLDTHKLTTILPSFSLTPVSEGLKATIDWAERELLATLEKRTELNEP
jgi:GDP-L-fucose synthase